ncbi:MAG TPA: LD-carboxypeptidase [Paludibacter sp.]|nr:LD-carboxypeptidase [Paludibacter sp.]
MTPPYLQPTDQVRIISPSGSVNPEFIDGAIKMLTTWGLNATEGQFARSEYGRFAGTEEQRVADLQQALDDPNVKAILCSRGGYGLAQIIDRLDFSMFMKSPKWVIGFSDVSILHNTITNLGIASIHGVMSKYFTELPADADQIQRMKEILFGKLPVYQVPHHALNRFGEVTGKLIGGNLSVLIGLRGSRFDMQFKNNILFIEDVGEKAYHIDRLMQNLRLSGALEQISGLVVGQFSECDEDPLIKKSIAQLISDSVKEYDYPVCFNFPAGHVDYNLPLILGAPVNLSVTSEGTKLEF